MNALLMALTTLPWQSASPVLPDPLPEYRFNGYLGITLPRDSDELVISEIQPGTAAARSGLQVGDLVKRVNGEVVRTFPELKGHISGKRPGTELIFEIQRGSVTRSYRVRIGGRDPAEDEKVTPGGEFLAPPGER